MATLFVTEQNSIIRKTSDRLIVVLTRESLKVYFAAYEKELTRPLALGEETASYRDLFRRQAERLAGALTRGQVYEPFLLPC